MPLQITNHILNICKADKVNTVKKDSNSFIRMFFHLDKIRRSYLTDLTSISTITEI